MRARSAASNSQNAPGCPRHFTPLACESKTSTPSKQSGQNRYNPVSGDDTLAVDEIRLAGFGLSTSINSLHSTFGKPDSIVSTINDFSGKVVEEHLYGQDVIYVEDQRFEGYHIKTARFELEYRPIRVGSRIDQVMDAFPISYRDDGLDQHLRVQIGELDLYLMVKVDDGVIQEFYTWTDW